MEMRLQNQISALADAAGDAVRQGLRENPRRPTAQAAGRHKARAAGFSIADAGIRLVELSGCAGIIEEKKAMMDHAAIAGTEFDRANKLVLGNIHRNHKAAENVPS